MIHGRKARSPRGGPGISPTARRTILLLGLGATAPTVAGSCVLAVPRPVSAVDLSHDVGAQGFAFEREKLDRFIVALLPADVAETPPFDRTASELLDLCTAAFGTGRFQVVTKFEDAVLEFHRKRSDLRDSWLLFVVRPVGRDVSKGLLREYEVTLSLRAFDVFNRQIKESGNPRTNLKDLRDRMIFEDTNVGNSRWGLQHSWNLDDQRHAYLHALRDAFRKALWNFRRSPLAMDTYARNVTSFLGEGMATWKDSPK